MEILLEGIPTDEGPIVDPFLGSGSTLLACLETGHDAIGMEDEKDYLKIADARVRYWNKAIGGFADNKGAEIESDVKAEEKKVDLGAIGDLFGEE